MKHFTSLTRLCALLCCVHLAVEHVQAQAIYTETFPATGAAAVSSVGWANDIVANPNRIYVFNGDRVFAFSGTATAEAFYTSTTLDTGATGQAFPVINPASYPFGVTLFADISAGYSPDEVRSQFAVQINGGNWYVANTPLNVPTTTTNVFVNYSMPFNPSAALWNNLTVTGTGSVATAGTPASVTIGGPAASNLTGNITGAGLVVTYGPTITAGGGTHDFDNFRIAATAQPGDVDLDIDVDLDDLLIIRTNFRTTVTSRIMGDLTNDSFVDFNDFEQWKENYTPGGLADRIVVPEPSSLLLFGLGLLSAALLTSRPKL